MALRQAGDPLDQALGRRPTGSTRRGHGRLPPPRDRVGKHGPPTGSPHPRASSLINRSRLRARASATPAPSQDRSRRWHRSPDPVLDQGHQPHQRQTELPGDRPAAEAHRYRHGRPARDGPTAHPAPDNGGHGPPPGGSRAVTVRWAGSHQHSSVEQRRAARGSAASTGRPSTGRSRVSPRRRRPDGAGGTSPVDRLTSCPVGTGHRRLGVGDLAGQPHDLAPQPVGLPQRRRAHRLHLHLEGGPGPGPAGECRVDGEVHGRVEQEPVHPGLDDAVPGCRPTRSA